MSGQVQIFDRFSPKFIRKREVDIEPKVVQASIDPVDHGGGHLFDIYSGILCLTSSQVLMLTMA